ncbi:uncharacterized protein Gasu_59800 [Galdieria sulphuraria]|uniref:Uncharacterized protein n=1 Tax=Galdieria sulphuraria TaxID=130081 RepID=M2VT71_GALSU|nr:uncharacterized protein Gasu_59800 [Galdieria sulphuraria]EME26361.1 hypothetical protein Gasu_59800 [Galdieria sulphuraria]|eukprot:XP_005702881.1 hypothetical protein Gasu_59800 [Galdieria sulphuraria]
MKPTSSCNSDFCTYGGFLLSGVTQSCDSVFGRFVDFEIFLPGRFKIDQKSIVASGEWVYLTSQKIVDSKP